MKGQVSVFYLGILTVSSIAIFGIILVWNLSIKDANTDVLAETALNSIIEKIEADIYYIESLNKTGLFEIQRDIPMQIGEDFYTLTLRADGTSNGAGGYYDNDQIIINRDSRQQFTLSKTSYSKNIFTDLYIIPSSSSSSNGKYNLRYNTSAGIEIY